MYKKKVVLGVLLGLAQHMEVEAQTPTAALRAPIPKSIGYDLKITEVNPGDYTELTPVKTSFELKPRVSGIVGVEPTPLPIDICPSFFGAQQAGGTCYHIASARPGYTYRGTINAIAPWAGLNSKLRIVAIENDWTQGGEFPIQRIVADARVAMPTAATYKIYFDGFNLQRTRSTSTDTVWLDMQGSVTSDPPHPSAGVDACSVVGFNWCLSAAKFGNAHNDGYRATPGRFIGDFRLTPEKEADLRFYFDLYNLGDHKWAEIAEGIGNFFSAAGKDILSAYGAASGNSGLGSAAVQIDGDIRKLHAAGTAKCDGPLAVDVRIFRNVSFEGSSANTLDGFTRATGKYSVEPAKPYVNKDGDYICDRAGSLYLVGYSLVRTSWQHWNEWPE